MTEKILHHKVHPAIEARRNPPQQSARQAPGRTNGIIEFPADHWRARQMALQQHNQPQLNDNQRSHLHDNGPGGPAA